MSVYGASDGGASSFGGGPGPKSAFKRAKSEASSGGYAPSAAGTQMTGMTGSTANSSTNTFQRRERAIWAKPTYKYQSTDPEKPFYVDPRILQVVAKNTPNQLGHITIPDGMNVYGKIQKNEKPKAELAMKLAKEIQKQQAENLERLHKKRQALLLLNQEVRHLNHSQVKSRSRSPGRMGGGILALLVQK